MFRVFTPINEAMTDIMTVVGVVDPYSLSLTRSAVSTGSFNMVVEYTENNRKLTKLDNIVEVLPDQATMGIITSRTYDLDRNVIMVSGHELKAIFDWHYTSKPAGRGDKWKCGKYPFSDYILYNYRYDPEACDSPDFVYKVKKNAATRDQKIACLVDFAFEGSLAVSTSSLHKGVSIACTECETLNSLLNKYSYATHEYPVVKLESEGSELYRWKVDWVNVDPMSDKYVIFEDTTIERNRVYTESNEGVIDVFSTFGERYFYNRRKPEGEDQACMFYQERSRRENCNKGVFCRHKAEDTNLKVGDTINFSSSVKHQDSSGADDMTWGEWHRIYTNLPQEIFYAIQTDQKNYQESNLIQCNQAMLNGYLKPAVEGRTEEPISKYECVITQLDIEADLYDIVNVKDLEMGIDTQCMISEVQYVKTGDTIEKIYTISQFTNLPDPPVATITHTHLNISEDYDAGGFKKSDYYPDAYFQLEKTLSKADITSGKLLSNETIKISNIKSFDLTLEGINGNGGTYNNFCAYPLDAELTATQTEAYNTTGASGSIQGTKTKTIHYEVPDSGEHEVNIKCYLRSNSSLADSYTYYMKIENIEEWD